ncbi:MAG: 30S ribosomal protein S8 [Solirubrobacterales bacterium]|nr:30S ribosomal protein S8 [Solirubrobacterales bacterium]MBV9166891.1 30S ribosomal protein S8 [Solirubrobacterales bacterium]MBV9535104.1 30S ribosomal protein S8 [Solirubrobacterales bacterium]
MTMTDPVADFLTRVRNALHAQRQDVRIPASRLKRELARILTEEGYINGYEEIAPSSGNAGGEIRLTLKYTGDRVPVISGLERVSRPGRRTYVNHGHIPRVQGGMGTAIVSTSRGVMTGHEARRRGVGGEVVARVW